MKKIIKIILIVIGIIATLILLEYIVFTYHNSNKSPREAPMQKVNP
jgi:flagellar basal body-associated protein FliL